MKKSGVQGLEIWLVGIVKLLKFQSGLWASTPHLPLKTRSSREPGQQKRAKEVPWPDPEGDVELQAFHGTEKGADLALATPKWGRSAI